MLYSNHAFSFMPLISALSSQRQQISPQFPTLDGSVMEQIASYTYKYMGDPHPKREGRHIQKKMAFVFHSSPSFTIQQIFIDL